MLGGNTGGAGGRILWSHDQASVLLSQQLINIIIDRMGNVLSNGVGTVIPEAGVSRNHPYVYPGRDGRHVHCFKALS